MKLKRNKKSLKEIKKKRKRNKEEIKNKRSHMLAVTAYFQACYNFLRPCQGARSFQNQSKFKNLYNLHTYPILSCSRGRQFTYLVYTILLLIGYQTKKTGVGATFYSYMCGDCIGFLLGLLSLFFKQQLIQYVTSFL